MPLRGAAMEVVTVDSGLLNELNTPVKGDGVCVYYPLFFTLSV